MRSRQLTADLSRIKTVIECDRNNVSRDMEKMLKYDLNCVLEGYFDYATPPVIKISPVRSGLLVEISFAVKRIKQVGTRPTDSGYTA